MPKISQLSPISQLTTSSILPVVDNGATQNVTLRRVVEFVSASIDVTFANEIELLQSASAITASLNTFASASILSVATKLSTSSFEAYTASVSSVNTSSLLLTSSFNTFTSSYKSDSASFDSRIDNLELINITPFLSSSTFNTFTSSYTTHSSSIDSRLDILEGINVTPFLSSSTFNSYTSSNESKWSSLGSQTGSFITEAETGSFLISLPNGLISGSGRIIELGFATTSSVLNIDTSSLVTTSSFNTYTASISTASLVSRLTAIENVSGSWITESETGSFLTSLNGAISSSEQVLGNSGVYSSSAQINGNIYSAGSSITIQDILVGAGTTFGKITTDGTKYISVMPTYNVESVRFWPNGNVTIQDAGTYVDNGYRLEVSGSTRIVGSFDVTGGITGSTNFDTIINKPTLISGSSQISGLGFATTSSLPIVTPFLSSSVFNAFATSSNTFTQSINTITASLNTFSSSVNTFTSSINTTIKSKLNIDGVISGSSQVLNSSNVLSSSVEGFTAFSSSVNTRINSAGGGGSTDVSMFLSQSVFNTFVTSSFMAYSGSINTFTSSINSYTTSINTATASLNGKTGSYATTGSNQFKDNQTITGSLTVTALTTISSSISANSSSLYLTSGSNLYVQNNGVVEITGSLVVSGSTMFVSAGGDEGGEIQFGIPTTNTTLQNRVTTDVFQNRYRIFEGSADAKGVYIDLSKSPAGVGGELLTKASGLVSRGTDVTLGNLKVRFASTGNMSLQVSTVTGTYSVYGSGIYTQNGSTIGSTIDAASPRAISTTPAYLISGYNFGTAGATDTWVIMDTSNTICWRITMIVGASYTNNFISIERLH